MKERHVWASSGNVHQYLPQDVLLLIASCRVRDVEVLWDRLPVLPALPTQRRRPPCSVRRHVPHQELPYRCSVNVGHPVPAELPQLVQFHNILPKHIVEPLISVARLRRRRRRRSLYRRLYQWFCRRSHGRFHLCPRRCCCDCDGSCRGRCCCCCRRHRRRHGRRCRGGRFQRLRR